MRRLDMPMANRGLHNRNLGSGYEGNELGLSFGVDYSRTIGRHLMAARKAKELRQADVADALGVSVSAVCAIEYGTRNLAPEHYVTVCKLLGLPIEESGRFFLRYTNPWLYDMLFGATDKSARKDLRSIPRRAP